MLASRPCICYTSAAMANDTSMIKEADMAEVAKGIAAGGGIGVAGGALATLFQQDKSLRAAAKNMLIGGTGGAAIGGAVTAINGTGDDREAQKDPGPGIPAHDAPIENTTPKQHMNEGIAALAGTTPFGAAIHGGISGGKGQAAWSGLSAAGGAVAGGHAGNLVGHGGLGAMAGSALAAYAAAHGFNKSQEKAASDTSRKVIGDFLETLAKLRVAHWQASTKTNEHAALGSLYDSLDGLVDTYAETLMGKEGDREMPGGGDGYESTITALRGHIDKLQAAAGEADADDLSNIAADMMQALNKASYLLS